MRWPHVVIAICVVLALLALWLITREVGSQANQLADRILPEGPRREISETFREYLTTVRAAKGDQLLVAEVQTSNELTVSDTRREYWTGVSFGTTAASIRYPVTYRYYITLSDRWRLALDGGTVWVQRPVMRPLEPAIDTAGIEFHGENGWLRWNRDEMKDKLLAELTPHAVIRARANGEVAQPHANTAVAAFVRAWLLAASGVAPRDARVTICEEIPPGLKVVDVRVP